MFIVRWELIVVHSHNEEYQNIFNGYNKNHIIFIVVPQKFQSTLEIFVALPHLTCPELSYLRTETHRQRVIGKSKFRKLYSHFRLPKRQEIKFQQT